MWYISTPRSRVVIRGTQCKINYSVTWRYLLKKHQQQPWHSVQKTCFVSVLDFTDSQEEYHHQSYWEKIALIFPQIMTIIITYAIVAVDVSLRWLCCHVTKYFYLHSGLLITTRLLDVLYVPHRLILIRYIYIILIIFFYKTIGGSSW